MQVKRENPTPTQAKLTITADQQQLDDIKQDVLQYLSQRMKIQGFRPGKAPVTMVEKQVDQSLLQTEFLEAAVNRLYVDAAQDQKLRPVDQPNVTVTKFVPFTTLEIVAEVEVVGDIKLADYKKIKLAPKPNKVTEKDVDEVVENLLTRGAEKKDVNRAAKDGDQVWIDFSGVDAKTKEAIAGAEGTDYPLALGSNTFIPGFEENLVGAKPDEEREFTLSFPADYGVKDLQKRKVTFTVTVKKVQEVVKPKLDDKFAASVGPFKTVDELRTDIKNQLTNEQQYQADRAYENELLEKIAEKTQVALPTKLVDDEIERMEQQDRQNVAYRGQTWQEHLDSEGVTAEEHKEKNRPQAELRVKAGLVLGEVAEREGIEVTPEELEVRIMLLKGQYTDDTMQSELDKPENRRDLMSRMMSEKTLDKLKEYAQKKA